MQIVEKKITELKAYEKTQGGFEKFAEWGLF